MDNQNTITHSQSALLKNSDCLQFVSSPATGLHGDFSVPGDKSISHRAIILGSIAQGQTSITGFLPAQDCKATLHAFQLMGVTIDQPQPDCLIVQGVGKYGLKDPNQKINCGNSGTTMRLLAGILAAQKFDSILYGDKSLSRRPMERISHPLELMGAYITTNDGKPPITLQGSQLLRGIHYTLPEASAQVKSCLLLTGLYAEGETYILEQGNTRDHTERMLAAFSYPVHKFDNALIVNAKSECVGTEMTIPGDLSSASFFIVAACIIPESEITIRNVGINPTRMGIIHILRRMGAAIEIQNKRLYGEEPVADLYIKHAHLEGIDIPTAFVPIAIDEFPIIFIAAACAEGQTLLHGAKELRFKESDRIQVMVEGLKQLGIHALGLDDGIFIQGGQIEGGIVDSQHDHRVAMAFAIAGAVATSPVTILNCDNVTTSFPNFIEVATSLQLNIKKMNERT